MVDKWYFLWSDTYIAFDFKESWLGRIIFEFDGTQRFLECHVISFSMLVTLLYMYKQLHRAGSHHF